MVKLIEIKYFVQED